MLPCVSKLASVPVPSVTARKMISGFHLMCYTEYITSASFLKKFQFCFLQAGYESAQPQLILFIG
jgi:hypothetical protein